MPQTLDHRPRPRVETAVATLLDQLTRLPPGPHRVVSCYLRLEPADRRGGRYLVALDRQFAALRGDARLGALSRTERQAVERDLARIESYLATDGGVGPARGLAVFACEALDMFHAAPLPRVHRTRVVLDDTPWVAELAAAGRQGETVAVLLDRSRARFFRTGPAGAVELPCGFTASARGRRFHSDRRDAPGRGERSYHARRAEERRRHYAMIAGVLDGLVRDQSAGIVLAGPEDQTTGLVRFLPDALATRVLGTAPLNPAAATRREVEDMVRSVGERAERRALRVELAELENSIGTGWAVEGAGATFGALSRGQVRALYLRDGLEGGGFRCAATRKLALAKSECAGEGAPDPVRDVVDEAIEETLRQGARVIVVPEDIAADLMDGLAATLRFR